MFCFLLLIVNISGPGSGLQIINANNPSLNIEQQDEITGTVISDIEEEGEEEEEVEEEITAETSLQRGAVNEEIGMKQKPKQKQKQKQKQGKKKEDMARPSSLGPAKDTPSTEDGIEDNFKLKLIDKSKKISKEIGNEARDQRHRPRKETFTMNTERKSDNCEAKTSGWTSAWNNVVNLICMILYRVGNQLEH